MINVGLKNNESAKIGRYLIRLEWQISARYIGRPLIKSADLECFYNCTESTDSAVCEQILIQMYIWVQILHRVCTVSKCTVVVLVTVCLNVALFVVNVIYSETGKKNSFTLYKNTSVSICGITVNFALKYFWVLHVTMSLMQAYCSIHVQILLRHTCLSSSWETETWNLFLTSSDLESIVSLISALCRGLNWS